MLYREVKDEFCRNEIMRVFHEGCQRKTASKYINEAGKGKKVYYISTEIYDYYLNIFKPSLDKYIEKYIERHG